MSSLLRAYPIRQSLPPGPLGQGYFVRDASGRVGRLKIGYPFWAQEPALARAFEAYMRTLRAGAGMLQPVLYPPVYSGQVEARPFVMDYWYPRAGVSGPLAPSIAVAWIWVFGHALARLHALGLVHGGVGRSNVGQDSNGQLHLLDAGWRPAAFARPKEVMDHLAPRLPYMDSLAPEVRQGYPLTFKADVYGLAHLLHEWLVGPFRAGVQPATFPPGWEEVLRAGLEPDPEVRADLPLWLSLLAEQAHAQGIRLEASLLPADWDAVVSLPPAAIKPSPQAARSAEGAAEAAPSAPAPEAAPFAEGA
ncbi:MAG: hypothetical protein GXO36_03850, partial [Chloroflexi bacterium]|nr:hypothetical protein [Chloroflexota bacterium]